METTFCELKTKEIVNVVDGKRLGKISDMVFNTSTGKILGLIVPPYKKSWNIFRTQEDIFIPYNCVCRIGDDIILVEINIANACALNVNTQTQKQTYTSQTQNNNEGVQTQNAKTTAPSNLYPDYVYNQNDGNAIANDYSVRQETPYSQYYSSLPKQ